VVAGDPEEVIELEQATAPPIREPRTKIGVKNGREETMAAPSQGEYHHHLHLEYV
jgi:hypothetical protein